MITSLSNYVVTSSDVTTDFCRVSTKRGTLSLILSHCAPLLMLVHEQLYHTEAHLLQVFQGKGSELCLATVRKDFVSAPENSVQRVCVST